MRRVFPLIVAVLLAPVLTPQAIAAQANSQTSSQAELPPGVGQEFQSTPTVIDLDERLEEVENRNAGGIMIFVFLLFAFFCALWAQNTKRNPWLWFFLGLVFSIITAFVVLHKNSMDLHTKAAPKAKPKS